MSEDNDLEEDLIDAVKNALKSPQGFIIIFNAETAEVHHAFANVTGLEVHDTVASLLEQEDIQEELLPSMPHTHTHDKSEVN